MMKIDREENFVVRARRSPTVEIDTEVSAAYVRFTRAKVARTVRCASKWPIVTIDLNTRGDVIGVEFVGVKRFDLEYLLRQVPITVPAKTKAHASYVSAEEDRVPT